MTPARARLEYLRSCKPRDKVGAEALLKEALAELERAMGVIPWTTERPSEPGKWFWKCSPHFKSEVVEVIRFGCDPGFLGFRMSGYALPRDLDEIAIAYPQSKWAGPIPEPTDAP